MRRGPLSIPLAGGLMFLAVTALCQEPPTTGGRGGANATPEQRAASTREFLGLGPAPDKAAAERGAPLFQANCSFCHGPQARGASGPNLVNSDVVLGDDHGEKLLVFLKKGRPEKGMPAFTQFSDSQLVDIAEFLHQQVEDVANRGTYRIPNIVVGDPAKGKAYVEARCMSCHTASSFDHIAAKFRTPDALQRGWIFPNRPQDGSLAVTATVKTADGNTMTGRLTQISDFKVTLMDSDRQTHVIERGPGVTVETKDPLAPHEALVPTIKNEDMHNVTAYLESLK